MWLTARAAATAAVLGAALVAASVHGHGSASGAVLPAAVSAPQTYQPPAVELPPPAATVKVLPAAAARPKVRTTPRTTHATPKPAATHHAVLKPKHRPVHHAAPATSYTAALNNAVARIPTYRPGTGRWVSSRAYAVWGAADWYHGVLCVSPDVPRSRLDGVAVHEWGHELSVLGYAGDVDAAPKA